MKRTTFAAIAAVAVVVVGVLAGPIGATGSTWFVALTGDDTAGCADAAHPCATIDGALAHALDGDTVEVGAGTYVGTSAPEVVLVQRTVTLSGGWNAGFSARVGATVVDGVAARRGITVASTGSLTASRFDIRRGSAALGGGIYVAPGGAARLVDSVLQENAATDGAAAYVDGGTLALVNVTVATGQADGNGGGVYLGGYGATLQSSSTSIVSNAAAGDGGGIYDAGTANETAVLRNTLIAGNTSGSGTPDCRTGSRDITSRGYNLVGSVTGCTISPTGLGDQLGASAHLDPLADNGGPTKTEALQPTSPAIDAGNPGGCVDDLGNPIAADQRAAPRSPTGADACDVGAYEVQPPSNDDFANALHEVSLPTVSGGNNEASLEVGEPEHAGDEGGASVWFTWSAPATGSYEIDTTGSTFDTLLAVYTGTDIANLTRIASNDDASSNTQTSRLCVQATENQVYDIAVDGYAGATGAYTLNVANNFHTGACPTLPPTVSPRNPHVGTTVTADSGTWVDQAVPSYQWYRCQAELCNAIGGATSDAYVVTPRDVGADLRVDVAEQNVLSISDPTAAVAATAPAHADGRIFWTNNGSGHTEIYSMLPGGTPQRLTSQTHSLIGPAPSPDGTKVAFGDGTTIDVMNADGSGIVATGLSGTNPSWSPDGSRLVYTHYDQTYHADDGLDVADADGRNVAPLLRGSFGALHPFIDPVWSPDGSKIAFTFLDETSNHYDIGVISADGRGGFTDVTSTATEDEHAPAWSPDGTELIFVRGAFFGGGPRSGDLYRIHPDGTGETLLLAGTVTSGVWSPDGTKVLLSESGNGGTDDLYTIDATDGSGITPVVSMSSSDESPAWAASASYALTVSRSGSGTVTSNLGGIACGGACSATYAEGTSVTLTASPDAGSTFSGWSGACSGTGTCTVSMLAARSVTASFAAVSPPPPPPPPAPPAPPSGGGGGGGGGGSSGIPPDIHVDVTASSGTTLPPVGSDLLYFVTVSSKNVGGSSSVRLDLTLPTGWTLDHIVVDRGPGCVGTPPALTCDVGWINQSTSTHVTLFGKVAQAGELDLTATATSQLEPEFDSKDNSLTLKLAPPAPPVVPPPPSPAPAPPRVTVSGGLAHVTAPAGATVRWQLCTTRACVAIKGATKPTLKLQQSYIGKSVRALVTKNGKTATSARVPVRARAASR